MKPRRFFCLASAALLAGACNLPFGERQDADREALPAFLHLTPCRLAGLDEEVRCGTMSVPADRTSPRGRLIPLTVLRLEARHRDDGAGPAFYFPAGPGQSPPDIARNAARLFVRDRHDVIVIEQRGFWSGKTRHCRTQVPSDRSPDAVPRCPANPFGGSDMSEYSIEQAIRDAEAVRAALGYEKINLVGEAGGSRTAIAYASRYPDHVRAAYLPGVVPPRLSGRKPVLAPAMMTAGRFDPASPPGTMEEAMKIFPNSIGFVIAATDRSGPDSCLASIATQFLDAADLAPLDISCAARPNGRIEVRG